MDLSMCGLWELVMDKEGLCAAVHGLIKNWTRLINWTELKLLNIVSDFFPYFLFSNLNLFILIGGYLFYNIVLVLPYITMNPPRVYTCSPSWSPLPRPSLYHPSGSSQCTAPSILYPASNLDWRLVLIWYYTCFNAIIPNHHTFSLSQSPKDCSKHLCLFCCLAYRVIVSIFLNSIICISILYWWFSFWLTSLCIIGSSFIHLIRTDWNVFFLMAE